jgi:quercetin dioxygenase-like cupin family protein
MYCREGVIPAGTVLVGKVHKTEHFIMVLKGRITVWTENGRIELTAPYIGICPSGVQRMGYAHEDTVFVNVHKTDKVNLADVEADLVETDPTAVYGVGNEIIRNYVTLESVKCLD